MKNVLGIGVILIISLTLSSCSFLINFVVLNESEAEIELEYTVPLDDYILSPESKAPPDGLVPETMGLSDWEDKVNPEPWQKLSEARFKFDKTTGKFIVRVAPGQVVKIIQTSDRVLSEENQKHFPITWLEIDGESGKITFEGSQILKQFRQREFSNRFIAYK